MKEFIELEIHYKMAIKIGFRTSKTEPNGYINEWKYVLDDDALDDRNDGHFFDFHHQQ